VLPPWSIGFRLRQAVRRRSPAARRIAAQRGAFYDEVWRDAAEHCGASIVSRGEHAFEIHRGERMLNVCCNTTDLDSDDTLELAGNKPAVHRLLLSHGLPTPHFVEFGLGTLSRALEFLASTRVTGSACVVKPARDTGGGHGVTTGITSPFELAWALAAALPLGGHFLIEQQVAGENYRLLYLDGKLVDAILRGSPQVVADGRSTVADLLDRLNADRVSRGLEGSQVLVTRDLDLRRTLARQGLQPGSVPPAGNRVILKTVINENSADDNESVRDRMSPSIIEAGMRAASLVGARLAGVDVVTTDISRSLSETGGVILEVNTTPGFHYHYHNRSGRCPVARHVLNAVLNAPGAIRELDYAI
jgi:cyanophycin synthetase